VKEIPGVARKNRKNIFGEHGSRQKIIFFFAIAFCLFPQVTPPVSLLLGLVIAQLSGHPYQYINTKVTSTLLQVSIVGLGFGMNFHTAISAGQEGFLFTIVSIATTLAIGFFIGRLLKIELKTSYLISTGTAICGGSAIASISPIIKADEEKISMALTTIYILNSIALFLFPYIGRELNLTQTQFGLWCAIAIHDTSSVIGAASKYGTKALEVATTVKLTRALWIVPVAFISAFVFKNENSRVKIPYFIGLFICAMLITTYVFVTPVVSHFIASISKAGLRVTLFLIGCGLSKHMLKTASTRPLMQGVILWIAISILALWFIVASGYQ
jgi:uncharacterized integral membrane protein (TIGR00698 family)